ncbi:uncharacterized protein LOC120332045 [Styela clava]
MKKTGLQMLKTFLLLALTRGLLAEKISVCSQPIRSIGYTGYNVVSISWILTNQNCKFQNQVLLLKLAEMGLRDSGYYQCRGYLTISDYRGSRNICKSHKNDCFAFYPENSTFVDVSIANDCTNVIWTKMKNILPITVKYFTESRASNNRQQFEMEIIYQPLIPTTKETIQKTTPSIPEQPISTTTQHSTVLSGITDQDQAVSSDYKLAIIFGVLLFIVLVVLFVVIVRYRMKIGNQLQTPQHMPSPTVEAANTSHGNECEPVYSVIKASDARSEQEVVVNELYNL